MSRFSNPLDHIKVASPCPANWNEMRGDERRRYCTECKLNVYNLSDMTRREAENFIINAEGRVCVKFYRRADGTVLTKDCPVGWQVVKKRISRTARAFVSMCAGIFSGVFAFNQFQPNRNAQFNDAIQVSAIEATLPANKIEDFENVSALPSITNDKPASDRIDENYEGIVGQLVVPIEELTKKQVNSKKNRRH